MPDEPDHEPASEMETVASSMDEETLPASGPGEERSLGTDPTMRAEDGDFDRTQPPGPTALEHPAAVGRYQILGRLGQGGMGTVYEAHDPELDRRVAVKLLNDSGGGRARGGLREEAQALAKLSHPNIVPVYDVGEAEGQVFLTMELVKGATVGEWVRRKKPDWRAVLEVFIQAAAGLSAAHGAGVVHRDVKPANIMLGDDGRVRVMDLGLAQYVSPGASQPLDVEALEGRDPGQSVALGGRLEGTPAYMAPEQFRGEACTPATDQFALCAALFRCLFQVHPFDDTSILTLCRTITEGEVREIPASTRVPRRVQLAILRGLSASADARFPDLEALVAELRFDPMARRRWAALGGIGVVAVGAMVWAATREEAVQPDQAPSCAVDQDRARGAWDDAARQGLRDAATPASAPAVEPMIRSLDDWAQAHLDGTKLLCEAETEKRLSAELRAAGDLCIAESFAALRGAMTAFRDGPSPETLAAVRSTAARFPPERCVDPIGLAAGPMAPTDPDAQAFRSRLVEALASVRGRLDGGDPVGAAAALSPIREEALQRDDPDARARVELANARVQLARGEIEPAAAAVLDATRAIEKGGHDGLRVDAITVALEVAAVDPARAGWAEPYAAQLDGLASRPGVTSQALGRALVAHGVALRMAGGTAAAKTTLERGLRRLEEALGTSHPDVAVARINLGNVLLGGGESEAALEAYRRGEAVLAEEGLSGHRVGLSALNNLGFGLLATGAYEEAAAVHRRSLAAREVTLGANAPQLLSPLNGIALAELGRDRAGDALPFLTRGAQLVAAHPRAVSAGDVAERDFAEARVRQRLGGEDATRAVSLAQSACRGYRALPHATRELSEVREWLSTHGGPDAIEACERPTTSPSPG